MGDDLKATHKKVEKKSQYPLKKIHYLPLIEIAIQEDQANHDITTRSIFFEENILVNIYAREKCIVVGLEVVQVVFERINPKLNLTYFCKDGDELNQNQIVMSIQGDIHSIFSAERIALNFLSFMSGIASLSRQIVQKLSPWNIQLVDTRKTIPGFRMISKYSVRIGGGENHRFSLADQGLIKDNHIAVGKIRNATLLFKKKNPSLFCQVEVEDINQLEQALMAKPDAILLDNMKPRMIKKCVKLIRKYSQNHQKKIIIEASGGYTIKNIKVLKNTGIDRVSMGSITMNPKPINFSLEVHQ